MNRRWEIRETGRMTGRALFIGENGDYYVAGGYKILRSDDGGRSWRLDCRLPEKGWKPWAARSRLAARLLRYYVAAFRVLEDGSRIAVAREGVFRAGPGEKDMVPVFRLARGSRPLNIAADGRRVLFGEYGSGLESAEVHVYVSDDWGRSFQVGYSFPRGDIRHVHNILVDPHAGHYWVLVGDFGRQPGIGALSKDLKTLDWIARGSQRCRAVGAVIEKDCLVYGTDSDRERNYIVRLDKRSGNIETLLEVEGSSLYAARFGPVRLISTCVEPNPSCLARECSLYASLDGQEWRRAAVHRKDAFHPVYFQFGALVLPYANNRTGRGMYSGQAVRGLDNRVAFVEFAATAQDRLHVSRTKANQPRSAESTHVSERIRL